jgi:hypothetical protein
MSKLHITLQTQKFFGPWHPLHKSFRASANNLEEKTLDTSSINGADGLISDCKRAEYIFTTQVLLYTGIQNLVKIQIGHNFTYIDQ